MSFTRGMEGPEDGTLELGNGDRASMQLFQQIYRDVTGKSEQLTKFYETNFCAVWGDFESLYQRLQHMLEQYHVVERSCAVRVSYTDDSHEQFSSFDRARVFDAGSMNIVESVTIEYAFLIVLPVAKKPQPYKISVNLSSREGLKEKARRHAGIEADLLSIMFASRTAMVAIKYIDYAVARTFQREIDKWFDALNAVKPSVGLVWLKRYSHHVPWVFKYFTAIVSATLFLRSIPPIDDLGRLYTVGIVAFSSIFVLSGIADRMGSVCERVIDGAQELSYIQLTRGDEKLVAEYGRSRAWQAVKAIFGFAIAVGANIAAAAIAHMVGVPS